MSEPYGQQWNPPAPTIFHCRHCAAPLQPYAPGCATCGAPAGAGTTYCPVCTAQTPPTAVVCVQCGSGLSLPGAKSKVTAGILGLFLGAFGVHRFYLGYTTIGVVQAVLFFPTCGLSSLWGTIEGILILTGNIDRDAEGRPLTS